MWQLGSGTKLSDMKILVTGANGQLGNELHIQLDKEFPGSAIYTDIEELDLTDPKAVEAYIVNNDITHIINCAAYNAVDQAEEEKMLSARINNDAVKNLAIAADANGAKIIHISTDYVFDGTNYRPYRESDKVNPISQYGTTKRKGETSLLALSPEAIIIRTAWLYSSFGHNFLKVMLEKANTQQDLKVVCDQIGTPTYARDLAAAIVKVIQSHQWVPGINKKVIPIPTEDYPTAAKRPSYSILDRSRIKATYGVEIPHWEESLSDCIKLMKQNGMLH